MPKSPDSEAQPGQSIAVLAESLYLLNLLLLPGLAFLALLFLKMHLKSAAPLAVSHVQQTVSASIWAGVILGLANGVIILLGGYQGAWTWVVAILYFTFCHSVLILLGAFGLSKAMNGQCWRYPMVGRPLPTGC
jgi:uncharacterized Tic20 family protein